MSVHASLYLIAHAPTHAMRAGQFPDDDPLDARGLAEATAVRDQWPVVALVLSSPARCALQTAAVLGLHARVEEALRDVDYGSWRGKSLAELAREMPEALNAWIVDPRASSHGGESHADVLERVGTWLGQLQRQVQGNILAITHAAIVRAALAHALGSGPQAMARIEIAPLSLVELRSTHDGWKWIARSYEHGDTMNRLSR
ncbi:histidine phosphatase family protein [Trinickia fusca]|uniref:Histidine phosphatase family protein n=1 Tax=Trinickia fusca TaxID=2419777 RepID=A0A494X788_9BURK|nr:histidine phosphatase family protein [Trinickia fusca]RKP44156.1 histidine phosphatase family protein [Trinickia fusca]